MTAHDPRIARHYQRQARLACSAKHMAETVALMLVGGAVVAAIIWSVVQ